MNKVVLRILLSTALFLGVGVSAVSAQSINLSNDPVHALQFSHYCPPYTESFTSNGVYTPTDRSCIYSIPTDVRDEGHEIVMALYKGTPGNATLVRSEFILNSTPATLVKVQDFGGFVGFVTGDKLFGTVFSAGPFTGAGYPDFEQFNEAFTTGATTTPNNTYHLIPWELGEFDLTPPDISVTTPAEGASYAQNQVVNIVASITDASTLKDIFYVLNDSILLDPNQPIPFGSVPLGAATLSVFASDIFDNNNMALVNFTITDPLPPPPVDVCPNVPGTQESGPCADQECVNAGGTWNGTSCDFPPPPDVCPNVPGDQASGPCADEECVAEGGTWDGDSCEFPPIETTLTVSADTYLRGIASDTNEGASPILRIQGAGDNRVLIRVDQAAIAAALAGKTLVSAKLELGIGGTRPNWGTNGREVVINKLLMPWTEGNGKNAELPLSQRFRGSGTGATWDCASDTNIQNTRKDCTLANDWNMRLSQALQNLSLPWVAQSTDGLFIQKGQQGVIAFDVTADIQSYLDGSNNYGWIVRKSLQNRPGYISFHSKETGSTAPKLILTIE